MTPQVADDVFCFTGTDVNWVILRDGDDLTLVDAGWHGDTDAVERSVRSLGRRPEDIRAVLLTHAHDDHSGALNHLQDRYGIPIYMAAAEVPNALGTVRESAGPLDVLTRLYRPRVAAWMVRIVRAGGLRHITVPSAQAFPVAGPLDLPGHPVPVATPGHTSGHTSYVVPTAGAVVTGDALVTAHPTVQGTGPCLLPGFFAHDQAGAIAALSTLRALEVDTIVPGHGPVWYDPISEAVDEALHQLPPRPAPAGHRNR